MANLIEQMNVLKGLPDETLQAELSAPSGSAPPFLIATEVQRRKGMRERYAAEQARRQPQTTVVDDLMAGTPETPPTALPQMTDLMAPKRAFASGGIVDAFDYGDLLTRYNDRLEGLSGQSDRARALALIAAGAGIMGGGSSNTLRNVGSGISAAIPMYQDQLQAIDTEELNLLRGIADVGSAQQQQSLEQMNLDFRERQLAQERELAEARLNADTMPAAVRTTEWFEAQDPETQATFERLNPPYNPNAVTDDLRRMQEASQIFDNALKALPEPTMEEKFAEGATAATLAAERQKQAALLAFPRWVELLGPERAASLARQYGVSDGDLLLTTGITGDAKAPPTASAAPAANGVIPFTDYF